MANIRLIRRRIKSAANIAQITSAMEMVAASKMKKAQEIAQRGKPYSDKIYQIVRELISGIEKNKHPLLSNGKSSGRILVILISTNKGLCGSLNTNLFRSVVNWFSQVKEIDVVSLGQKGTNFSVRYGYNLIADFSTKTPFSESVAPIAAIFVDGFMTAKYKEVYIAYNSFVNALKQAPSQKLLLPITSFNNQEQNSDKIKSLFVFEPSIDEILEKLLPHYLENQIRSAIFEAEASEHSARMIAMKNATEAAQDFMAQLTLVYNKARQEKITYEIADMVTARLAVEYE